MFAASTVPGDFWDSLCRAKVIYGQLVVLQTAGLRWTGFLSQIPLEFEHSSVRKVEFWWLWVYLKSSMRMVSRIF